MLVDVLDIKPDSLVVLYLDHATRAHMVAARKTVQGVLDSYGYENVRCVVLAKEAAADG